MPFVSRAQERWGFSPAGKKALGGAESVKEWADSTDQSSLPERKMAKRGTLFGKPKGDVIKHPGALTAAAKAHGRSKLQEAEKESHSSDPSIRSRGNPGKRFIKKEV